MSFFDCVACGSKDSLRKITRLIIEYDAGPEAPKAGVYIEGAFAEDRDFVCIACGRQSSFNMRVTRGENPARASDFANTL